MVVSRKISLISRSLGNYPLAYFMPFRRTEIINQWIITGPNAKQKNYHLRKGVCDFFVVVLFFKARLIFQLRFSFFLGSLLILSVSKHISRGNNRTIRTHIPRLIFTLILFQRPVRVGMIFNYPLFRCASHEFLSLKQSQNIC